MDFNDAVDLMRYIIDDEVSVDQDAIDINNDGKVDPKDTVLLLQYISGWDVTL